MDHGMLTVSTTLILYVILYYACQIALSACQKQTHVRSLGINYRCLQIDVTKSGFDDIPHPSELSESQSMSLHLREMYYCIDSLNMFESSKIIVAHVEND
jgi:hypothetical protein